MGSSCRKTFIYNVGLRECRHRPKKNPKAALQDTRGRRARNPVVRSHEHGLKEELKISGSLSFRSTRRALVPSGYYVPSRPCVRATRTTSPTALRRLT